MTFSGHCETSQRFVDTSTRSCSGFGTKYNFPPLPDQLLDTASPSNDQLQHETETPSPSNPEYVPHQDTFNPNYEKPQQPQPPSPSLEQQQPALVAPVTRTSYERPEEMSVTNRTTIQFIDETTPAPAYTVPVISEATSSSSTPTSICHPSPCHPEAMCFTIGE